MATTRIGDDLDMQEMIPDSRLRVLPGDSCHVAAIDADRCADETLAFIREEAAR
jgi:hypothetical protein